MKDSSLNKDNTCGRDDQAAKNEMATLIDKAMEDQRAFFMKLASEGPAEPEDDLFMSVLASPREILESQNPTTQDLGHRSLGNCIVGFVDEVNGPGSVEVGPFSPSRFELGLLARHWAKVYLWHDYYWVVWQSTGSDNWREQEYAKRRLTYLAQVAGEQLVHEAVEEVQESLWKEETQERKGVQEHASQGEDGAEPEEDDEEVGCETDWRAYAARRLKDPRGGFPLVDILVGPWAKRMFGLGPDPDCRKSA